MNSPVHILPGIARIRERFLAMHNDRHDDLEDRLTVISAVADCGAALHDARGILHKIAGTAGSLGLADLGEAALKAECLLQELTDSDLIDRAPVIAELNRFLEVSINFCDRGD